MSWQTQQLKYSLGISGLLSFYGAVGVGVWLIGDRMGYDMAYRVVTIALVLLTLPIALVGGYFATRKSRKEAKAQEAAEQAGAEQSEAAATPQKISAPTGNYAELNTSAEEAVQFLKNSNLGAGKDVVYALPWYLIAGTPKSGKTSLALASNLNFQNLPSQRQSEQNFIRPTRNVDWRVTSDAVFLDTAGRYQTEGVDQDEWAALLDIIKNYRGKRPLDGLILTVSAERILHADESEIEQMARVLRTRIDEAVARTKVRFPIYLVFTHADAIEGFRDSFSTSQREGQMLVWGATIPLEHSANAHALFDGEYDLLQNSVMKRRLIRLSAPFAPIRQLKIFNFPLHFGTARRKLGAFVSTLFRPNPFSESPFLRGFYFTAVPVNRQNSRGGSGGGGGQTQVGMQTVGQSFFTDKLFRDVILRDKDLLANLQAQKVRPPLMGWLLTLAGAFLTLLFLGLSANSLYQNKKLIDEASKRGDAVLTIVKADVGKNPLDKAPEETRTEINATEKLRESLEKLDDYERNGAPFWMRFGLYSGNRIYHEKLLPIYFNAVEQRFKRPTIARLQKDLRAFTGGQSVANQNKLTPQEEEKLGKNYDLLKAYLMLSGTYKEKAEPTFLATTLSDYWKSESQIATKVPDMSATVQSDLAFWAKQVDRPEFPQIPLDDALIKDVQAKLQAFPAVLRYYKRVTTEISKKGEPVKLEVLLAGRSAGVFAGNPAVPYVYTIDGYNKYMKSAISNAQEELTKDDWVVSGKVEKSSTQDPTQVLQQKYFNDYTENWIRFVRETSVAPYKNSKGDYDREVAINALKAFSSTDSPMKIVLNEVAKETNFSGKAKTDGWWDWIKSFFVSADQTQMGGEAEVEKPFAPLFTFVGSDEKAESPMSQYGTELKKLSDTFASKAKNDADIKKITQELEDGRDSINLGTAEKNVNNLVEAFSSTSAGQEVADLLRQPINNLSELFGAGVQQQIKRDWENSVFPKAQEAEKGFPFADSGDADLVKLTMYLNPQSGTLSDFYTKRLAKNFETTNGELKAIESSKVQFNPDFVAYLNNAFRLRRALFGEDSKTPQFSYEIKLQKTDAPIELTIDGQKVDSSGSGSATLKFPASSGDSGVVMSLGSAGMDTTSANSSDSSVSSSGDTNSASQTNTTNTPSGSTSLKFPGTWGLFKFVEAGSPKKQVGGEYLLTYKLGGKTVTATIKPSGGDLFDRTIWSSVKAPQGLLKLVLN